MATPQMTDGPGDPSPSAETLSASYRFTRFTRCTRCTRWTLCTRCTLDTRVAGVLSSDFSCFATGSFGVTFFSATLLTSSLMSRAPEGPLFEISWP